MKAKKVGSTIESSLERIEEHVEMSSRLLDRSRVECTIVSGLAKLEQQNIHILKALFTSGDTSSSIKSCCATIEEQNADFKKAFQSSLAKIEERLAGMTSLEATVRRLDQQLNSSRDNQSGLPKQRAAKSLFGGSLGSSIEGDRPGGAQTRPASQASTLLTFSGTLAGSDPEAAIVD